MAKLDWSFYSSTDSFLNSQPIRSLSRSSTSLSLSSISSICSKSLGKKSKFSTLFKKYSKLEINSPESFIYSNQNTDLNLNNSKLIKKISNKKLVFIKSLRWIDQNHLNLNRFIKLLWKLKHPNLVRFYGLLNHPNNLCLVYEFCTNGSLKNYLKQVSYLT